MKGLSTIFAIIVLVLWLGSVLYITAPAAPSSVPIKLPSPPMGGIPSAFIGVLLFLLSIIVIVIWVALTPEEAEEKKKPEVKEQK
jgi:hypothetical protein